jgi:DNA-binding CsgD family transcriptional regulator
MSTETSLITIENAVFLDNLSFNRYDVMSFKQPLYDRYNTVIGIFGLSFILNAQNEFLISLITTKLALNQTLHDCIYQKNELKKYKLTARQLDCLYYLVQGKTAKQIANLLQLSYRTVEHHISAIKTKYRCGSRSELIEKALTMPCIKQLLFYRN